MAFDGEGGRGNAASRRSLSRPRCTSSGVGFGAYLGEIHLNKRAGYFTVMALDWSSIAVPDVVMSE